MHNFPKDISIICNKKHTLKEAKEIFHLCIDNDVVIHNENLKNPINIKYPYFIFDGNDLHKTLVTKKTYPNDGIYVSLDEFKAFIQGKGKYTAPFKEEIKLNSHYNAVVTKEHVKVGCQTFSHEKVKQLYQLSQKAIKSS